MNNLSVHVINSQEEFDKFMDKLNKETAIIMDNVYQYYINELSNNQQKKMFHDWWYGKCVSTDEYKSCMSEDMYYEVSSCILEACSRGFG